MILLNSQIIWLEESHLTYQFVNALIDRIPWVMLNLWDMLFTGPPHTLSHWGGKIFQTGAISRPFEAT